MRRILRPLKYTWVFKIKPMCDLNHDGPLKPVVAGGLGLAVDPDILVGGVVYMWFTPNTGPLIKKKIKTVKLKIDMSLLYGTKSYCF